MTLLDYYPEIALIWLDQFNVFSYPLFLKLEIIPKYFQLLVTQLAMSRDWDLQGLRRIP